MSTKFTTVFDKDSATPHIHCLVYYNLSTCDHKGRRVRRASRVLEKRTTVIDPDWLEHVKQQIILGFSAALKPEVKITHIVLK
jgi:uncharacterized Fe-S cluster protein YjdI